MVCLLSIFVTDVAVCAENSGLSERYHTGVWNGRRWSCCKLTTRNAEGCDSSSWSARSLITASTRQTVTSAAPQPPSATPVQALSPATLADSEQQPASRTGEYKYF